MAKSNLKKYLLMVLIVAIIISMLLIIGALMKKPMENTIVKEKEPTTNKNPIPNDEAKNTELGIDYYCPWEINDWKLDADCGKPEIYDFTETRSPEDYLNSDMIHWADTGWRNYQPLIDKVNEITEGVSNDYEKATAIANWVMNSKPYGEPSPANEGKSIIEIYNSNTGVCMDAGLLTAAMFRIAGIPSRAVLPTFHEYAEAYIDGRWVGFDSTFGNGEAIISDPVTAILSNNEFYKSEPKYTVMFSDGTPREIVDVTYYKVNKIPKDILKSAEANVEISIGVNTADTLTEKSCDLHNSRTGENLKDISFPYMLQLNQENNVYMLMCKLIFASDPLREHNDHVEIKLVDNIAQTLTYVSSGYLNINFETSGEDHTVAGWGTIYIPVSSRTVFKNKDGTFSLDYDKNTYSDFVDMVPVIKANNLDCTWYHCSYTEGNDYSKHIPLPGILGYGKIVEFGTRDMPTPHYNGFLEFKLPEGKYKLIYQIEGKEVATNYFEVYPNQKYVIYPNQLTKLESATENQFDLLQTALKHSIEGLNP